MKKFTTTFVMISILSVFLLTGCGGSTTKTNTGNNNYVPPTFLSTEAPSTIAKETQSQTEANVFNPEDGTIIPNNNDVIYAMTYSPYLNGITLYTDLQTLQKKYKKNYVYNQGTKSYQWDFGDDGRVIAIHDDDNPNSIIEISYYPSDYSKWKYDQVNFAGIDPNKTYKYYEAVNILGTMGVVSKLSLTPMLRNSYHISWHKTDGTVLIIQFDSETNESVSIRFL